MNKVPINMNTYQWTKNTVVPDLSAPMLHYHQYVDVQQQKDFEQTGSNVRRDRDHYQKAYGSYCSKYRKMLEEINDTN